MQPCRSCRERAWLCVLRRARLNFNARSAFVAERERDTLDERQPDRRAVHPVHRLAPAVARSLASGQRARRQRRRGNRAGRRPRAAPQRPRPLDAEAARGPPTLIAAAATPPRAAPPERLHRRSCEGSRCRQRAYDKAIEWAQMGTNSPLTVATFDAEATKTPV